MPTSLELSQSNRTYSLDPWTSSMFCSCGGTHFAEDHWKFIEGMPQDPVDLVDDLIQMGHYSDNALEFGKALTYAEFRKAILLKAIDQAPLEQRQLCNELIKLAGGLDEALAAAFGPNAIEFLGDAVQLSHFRRRDFLIKVAAAAAVVTVSSCASGNNQQRTESSPAAGTGNLEKKDLTVGFIPIACSIPILVGESAELYKKYGLNVTLKKMPNWAAVRESAIAGELDAYHMLSPMPISISLGLGSSAFPIRLASIENINGQSIAVAMKHKDTVKGAADFKGMTIGVPFPYSMHNLLMRYYLASGGLNPDRDVKLEIVPPPDSVARMAAGQIDAFLMPDNFGQRAIFEKVGFIHMLTKDLWNGHPCCAFAASQKWIDTNPNSFRTLNKAIIEAANYANEAKNRESVAQQMAARKYLNQPEPVLKAVMTGKFDNGLGESFDVPDRIKFDPYPWQSFAKWISSQMVRWDLMPTEKAKFQEIADQIYMTDLARELSKELGQTPPSEPTRTETLKFDTFDPAKVDTYVQDQVKKFGV
ncbi:MAG: ABC transporter substrate-binding protein [Leptolyngbya sp. Prado105]|nr:ABC transporter substrate-binding protein [Leptolyngbya sp. Prado105]